MSTNDEYCVLVVVDEYRCIFLGGHTCIPNPRVMRACSFVVVFAEPLALRGEGSVTPSHHHNTCYMNDNKLNVVGTLKSKLAVTGCKAVTVHDINTWYLMIRTPPACPKIR